MTAKLRSMIKITLRLEMASNKVKDRYHLDYHSVFTIRMVTADNGIQKRSCGVIEDLKS